MSFAQPRGAVNLEKEKRCQQGFPCKFTCRWTLEVWKKRRLCHAESPSWTVQRLRNMICTKECGVGEERRSRPSRVAFNHATKDQGSTMYALSGSAPGHMTLLPPIHIPQAPQPLCSHPYSDPTRLVLRGERQAGRPAPLRSAPGSREEGYN